MDSVVHFEMPYRDRERMKTFYESVFGWQTQSLGPEMGNYVLATTAETGPDGRPATPGTINGGFYQCPEDPAGHAPSVVIAVSDINEAMRKITAADGTLPRRPDGDPRRRQVRLVPRYGGQPRQHPAAADGVRGFPPSAFPRFM